MAMINVNRFSALDADFENSTRDKAAEKPKEAKSAAPSAVTLASAPVCAGDAKCSRCGGAGHFAKDCKLSFTRDLTRAEMREKRIKDEAEKARKKAEWEAQQAKYEKKKAAWAERQAAWAERKAKAGKDWDARSDVSLASTAATSTLTDEQELEVCALVAKDKEVRRLEKLLRDIAKLEESTDLDALQLKKVNRKSEIEVALETTRGLLAARARNQVRQQGVQLGKMD